MNIPHLYANVLRWNVAFCVPVPDNDYAQMVSLLEEEYNEYTQAASKEERLDALGDMMVVALGICARLVIMPTIVKKIIELANAGKQEIKVDLYIMTDVVNAIRGNYNQAQALSELVTILDCAITASGNNTDDVVNKIMEHNWRKTWTAEETKGLGPEYLVIEPLKGYVVKKAGKVQKPPSFKHPQELAKLNPAPVSFEEGSIVHDTMNLESIPRTELITKVTLPKLVIATPSSVATKLASKA